MTSLPPKINTFGHAYICMQSAIQIFVLLAKRVAIERQYSGYYLLSAAPTIHTLWRPQHFGLIDIFKWHAHQRKIQILAVTQLALEIAQWGRVASGHTIVIHTIHGLLDTTLARTRHRIFSMVVVLETYFTLKVSHLSRIFHQTHMEQAHSIDFTILNTRFSLGLRWKIDFSVQFR